MTTTLKAVSVFWFIFGFIFSSNYFAGEIRLQKRTHIYSMPGAVLLAVIVLALLVPTFKHVVGEDFSGATRARRPRRVRVRRRRARIPGVDRDRAGSPVVGIIVIIGFTIGLVVWLPQTLLLVSRNMFAWSFDRVMPDAPLLRRLRGSSSPLWAIGVMLVLGIASTAIYSFTTWFSSLSALLGLSLPLLVTAVGGDPAAVPPPRTGGELALQPPCRRASPCCRSSARWRFLGFAAAVAVLLWDPGSGASLSQNPGKLELAVAVYIVGIVIWYVARAVRRTQGIDIDLSYRELPAA